MGTKNPSAPPRTHARPAGNTPLDRRPGAAHRPAAAHRTGGGIAHDNTRHTSRFTVIGNHLTQHHELSLLAIGLGAHLQSLPEGAPVGIKALTARFPEGATRIAAALRELEAHGYLRRERCRTPSGRIVTRTVSCNQPTDQPTAAPGRPEEIRLPRPTPHPEPRPEFRPDSVPEPRAEPRPESDPELRPESRPEPREVRRPCAESEAAPKAREPRPCKPLPAVPRPAYAGPGILQAATDLLAGLRRHDPSLLLSARDTAHLAPGVAAWLERDVTPAVVRRALTADLPPEGVRRPAAFLAHRLAAQLPPPPPFRASAEPTPVRHPVQNCDGCDRGFRAPEPGRCRDCRTDHPEDA